MKSISIHALRVEGDRRRTFRTGLHRQISIHALRVEGDGGAGMPLGYIVGISIHALRVEGDFIGSSLYTDFCLFLSTPSVWRATDENPEILQGITISIHALRVEGDTSPRFN